jgi:hypothetical protein
MLVILLFLVLVTVLATWAGTDSRDGKDWQPLELAPNRDQ